MGLRCQADLVFAKARVACFVDGCQWHGCEEHFSLPKTNTEWWAEKLAWTKERDGRNNRTLSEAGWTVVRVWEHEDPVTAAARIQQVLCATGGTVDGRRC